MKTLALALTLGTACLISCSKGGGSSATPDSTGSGDPGAGTAPGGGGGTGTGGAGGGNTPGPGGSTPGKPTVTAGINLPKVTPPVKAATPAGFLASGLVDSGGLGLTTPPYTSDDIKARFFSAGPSNLLDILSQIDGFITGVNTASTTSQIPCLTQAPVDYTINVFGQAVPFIGQCYSVGTATATDPQLRQFGIDTNGVIYLYSAYGAERVAAIVTPISGEAGKYKVQAWIGVGYTTAGQFDSGSYGVWQLTADSSTNAFEMSVAFIGDGFCGLQMQSDGTNVYANGSADAAGNVCAASSDLCVLSSDLSTAGNCTNLMTFTLPALGRGASTGGSTWGASTYPVTPNITLDGTSTDSLRFGPTAPTTGVGNFATQTPNPPVSTSSGTGTTTGTTTSTGSDTSSGTGTGTGS